MVAAIYSPPHYNSPHVAPKTQAPGSGNTTTQEYKFTPSDVLFDAKIYNHLNADERAAARNLLDELRQKVNVGQTEFKLSSLLFGNLKVKQVTHSDGKVETEFRTINTKFTVPGTLSKIVDNTALFSDEDLETIRNQVMSSLSAGAGINKYSSHSDVIAAYREILVTEATKNLLTETFLKGMYDDLGIARPVKREAYRYEASYRQSLDNKVSNTIIEKNETTTHQ